MQLYDTLMNLVFDFYAIQLTLPKSNPLGLKK